MAEGPQRFRTGARERGTGIGLGLTIVMGQAHVLGAQVSYPDSPGEFVRRSRRRCRRGS
ncbi:hypothetical protein ACWDBD_45465 [Streptomyces sp. NPDC001118]